MFALGVMNSNIMDFWWIWLPPLLFVLILFFLIFFLIVKIVSKIINYFINKRKK